MENYLFCVSLATLFLHAANFTAVFEQKALSIIFCVIQVSLFVIDFILRNVKQLGHCDSVKGKPNKQQRASPSTYDQLKMLRKILFVAPPSAVLYAAAPVKSTPAQPVENVVDSSKFTCKPSDLPLYQSLHEQHRPKVDEPHPQKDSVVRQTIESGVCAVRTQVEAGLNIVGEQKAKVDYYIDTAKAHTQGTIDYLNEPQNVLPRSGAIAVGGLSGFIFAARNGFIKKVLYTAIGAGAVASLCYPRQAEVAARDALVQARKGYVIAYNFVKGVKPGDEVDSEPLSNFPTSMQDLKYLFLDLYDEAKEAIFGKKP